jgi:outer membrane protein, heavy metal efflux system
MLCMMSCGWACRLRRRHSVIFLFLFAVACSAALAQPASPLSLNEALQLAADQSPQLTAQRYGISAAEQAIPRARELPDPKLILGVDNLPVTGPDQFSLTRDFMTMRKVGVMQDFVHGEKRSLKGKLAENVAAREQAILTDAQAGLRRDVASAWVERYFAEQMAQAVDAQLREAQLQSDALQAGIKSGKTPAGDLLAAQLTVQTLLDRRAEFEKQSGRAKAMLSRWVGDAATRPLAALTLPALASQQASLADHVTHHPHLQSLDRQIDVVQTEASLAQASTKPDWNLELTYQQRGSSYSNMVSVQVSIDLPVFQRNRQGSDIAVKMAQLRQARELKDDALRQHLAEAQAAWSDWDAARARLARFDASLLPLAHERVQAALASYRGGKGNLSAVLAARHDETDVKLQKLQLEADQARAYAQLLYFLPGESAK